MQRKRRWIILACFAVAALATPANAISIYLSKTTTTGSAVAQNETETFNIAGGGTGTLGIWITDITTILTSVNLNLRIENVVGVATLFTGATINNPTIGSTKRWFDDGSIVGVGVDLVASNEIRLTGITTDTGIPGIGEGTGLGVAADPDDDGADTAFLFATVSYGTIDPNDAVDLFLQIGDSGISDSNGLVTNVVLGLADPALDASNLSDRNVNSATRDGFAASFLAADFNLDTQVDSVDLTQWQGDFGVNGQSDADGDGDSDGADFLIWQRQFGSSVGPLAAAIAQVPEPASSTLLIGMIVVGLFLLSLDKKRGAKILPSSIR